MTIEEAKTEKRVRCPGCNEFVHWESQIVISKVDGNSPNSCNKGVWHQECFLKTDKAKHLKLEGDKL